MRYPSCYPRSLFVTLNPFTAEYAYNLTQMGINDVSILSYEEEGKRLGRDLDEILFEIVYNRIGNSSKSTHYLYGGSILVSSAFQTNIFVEREF